eukprot:TRINITY_DN673_c0_g1_i2.p1 TRINITY_DN673_c0_g1~~TRINITY_DN673_c0_g1_i2.p1  ORF type:complete len:336 (-),score=79.93 TRINITY_DN673_c0_g1_i2:204-1211(-)
MMGGLVCVSALSLSLFVSVVCGMHLGSYPSGMPWPSGFSNDIGDLKTFASFRGKQQDVGGTWLCRDTWSVIASGGCRGKGVQAGLDFCASSGWPKSSPTWYAVALLPEQEQSDLGACAKGAYNSYFEQLGSSFVAAGLNFNTTYIRLGWEANGNWYAWGVGPSSNDQYHNNFARSPANFVGCYRNARNSIKSKATNLRFNWNMNKDGAGNDLQMYPGDQYVDVIDVDYYNSWPTSTTLDEFNANINEQDDGVIGRGLNKWLSFAVSHNKTLALSEWGLGSGDYPAFIQGMYNFFVANQKHIEYETFYNQLDSTFRIYDPAHNPNPNAAAEYKKLF